FYGTMNRDNVSLVPYAVERVTETGIVAANGVEYPADALIIGTGFLAQQFLGSLTLRGIGGRSLHDVWGASAKAFLGSTLPCFPNFFMLYGPKTNGGVAIIYQAERRAEAVVRFPKRIQRKRVTIDPREPAYSRYTNWIDRVNAKYLSATFHCH